MMIGIMTTDIEIWSSAEFTADDLFFSGLFIYFAGYLITY